MGLTISLIFPGPTLAGYDSTPAIANDNDKEVILTFGFPSRAVLAKRINILIWNLHKGTNATFATDFISLGHQKDLIISQEMYLSPFMRTIFDTFPHYFYTSATSFYFGKKLIRTGVMTSSPVLPTYISYLKTETLEPVSNSPKVTLITRYPLGSSTKELTVVNIHGINFVDGSSYQKEMNRIYEALKNIAPPIIFAGDFNSWNSERYAILKEICQKLKLNAAIFSPDYRKTFKKYPLDHFYHTRDLKIISAKVEDFYQGSDHNPLEVVVEYSPRLRFKQNY